MNEYYFDGYKVTELSYFDYKNLVKNLLTEDIEVLNNVFNDIFNKHIDMQNFRLKYPHLHTHMTLYRPPLAHNYKISMFF